MEASLLETIRFGYGPTAEGAAISGGVDPARVLAQLDLPDPFIGAGPSLVDRLALYEQRQAEAKGFKAGRVAEVKILPQLKQMLSDDVIALVALPASADAGFRERLVQFWANRLTVGIRPLGPLPYIVGSYAGDVARPHVTGRYADMIKASAWHPAMLLYLDQAKSVGPDSRVGMKRESGLNENYARELLELHTMGSGYSQQDVTETARLLTGMRLKSTGSLYDPSRAEPGSKTILGQSFSPGEAEINRFLEFIALRPETARSVSHALARQFLADAPSDATVDRMAAAYLDNGSALVPVYAAMMADPAATATELVKIRSPQDYMAATLRAVGWLPAAGTAEGKMQRKIAQALGAMGQPPFRPRGPNGWPDTTEGWVSSPMLAARLDWAETVARRVSTQSDDRAEPVPLAQAVLGDLGSPDTIRAAGQAEQRWEGIAVVLGSPDFMRR